MRGGLKRMLEGSLAHPKPALAAFTAGLANGLTMVLGAAAIGWTTMHPGWLALALILGVSALRWTTIIIRGIATGMVQFGSQARSRREVLDHVVAIGPPALRRYPSGRVLAHAVTDVDSLWFPMTFTYFAIGMVLMLMVALVRLTAVAPVLGLVGLGLIAAVLGLAVVQQRLLMPRSADLQAARGELSSVAHETVSAVEVVRALGLQDRERERFAAVSRQVRTSASRVAAGQSFAEPMLDLLPSAAALAILAIGLHGGVPTATLVEFVYLLLTAAIPLSVISRFTAMLPVSAAGDARLGRLMGVDHFERREAAEGRRGAVHARSLASAPALTSIDLSVEPGEFIAVVGPPGSGKSTLLAAIAGLWSLDDGSLTVGGEVAFVPQSAYLFATTLRDNLTLGLDREVGDDELWQVLRDVGGADIVTSLDTVIGERGSTLSGGQRQRVCLARALLRRPALLLLDDATSALDPELERRVLEHLARLSGPLSIIAATSRPAVAAIADRVVELRGGRLEEVEHAFT